MSLEPKRWVVAMSERAPAMALVRDLSEQVRVRCAQDGLSAIEMVYEDMPDVLVADLVLPCLEGAALFERVRTLRLSTLPYAVALGIPGMAWMDAAARKAGACRILPRSVDAPRLMAAARALRPTDRLQHAGVTLKRIERALWALGFSSRMMGTPYLACAVDLACRDAALLDQLTDVLYPLVAGIRGGTAKQVDHGIRRAIDAAWSSGPRDAQYRLFGNTIDAKRGKPTSGAMIACMADLFRTGMEITT